MKFASVAVIVSLVAAVTALPVAEGELATIPSRSDSS